MAELINRGCEEKDGLLICKPSFRYKNRERSITEDDEAAMFRLVDGRVEIVRDGKMPEPVRKMLVRSVEKSLR